MIRHNDRIELPALATAHSHAFQRGLRGDTQRPGPAGTDDFWSWRTAMYKLASELTPESLYSISLMAYRELQKTGVRTVGEFHYVHHDRNGEPYEERTLLSDTVIRAAKDAGLRIALLRVVYARAGKDKPPSGAQLRFCDARLEDALDDIDILQKRYAGDPAVRIGVAPHSVRAVPPSWLPEIARFAEERRMLVHMHVAEQPAEIEACLEENGKRPVELVADAGLLGPRFVAVHATHLAPHEPSLLGRNKAFVCLCPTTERDLGDGLPQVGPLYEAGARLCVGVDSHVITHPLEDLRLIELGERLRTQKRVLLRPSAQTPAQFLWHVGSILSAQACGFEDTGGLIRVRSGAPELMGVRAEHLLDALVFSAGSSVFEEDVPATPNALEGPDKLA